MIYEYRVLKRIEGDDVRYEVVEYYPDRKSWASTEVYGDSKDDLLYEVYHISESIKKPILVYTENQLIETEHSCVSSLEQ